ncbi:MAG: DsbC family protein [Nitrospirota bacterium]|nr:DsbC family protein [Nitrospirota bacterium]MDH5769247.1 DsbC family protein [Nitrospirota bacterium]
MKKKVILISILLASCFTIYALSSTTHNSYALDKHDLNCEKCHSLTALTVQDILKKLKAPDIKILNIQMSPVKGFWEVSIEDRGRYGLLYVDFSNKYIFARGSIIDINAGIDKSRQRLDELNRSKRIDLSRIPLGDALLLGDEKAVKKVIVFTDPDCPYCAKFHNEIKKVTEKRKDIAFYVKLMPLIKLHPDAYKKSKSIVCNKSLTLLEESFAKKPVPEPNCETKEIDDNMKLGEELGITGTPAAIMPDGSVQAGYLEENKLIERIDSSEVKK